uniref:RAS p21 protein activator 4 n=1 Tax=Mandrillus leucophaeus TaxID=9568 RepID=A0A2K5YRK5_MANLE
MAKRSSLYIRIVEGKNLPAKDITGSSDPYCIVKVDNEPIIRTATVWKTLCPFWGEEYQVHLPPTFHTVAFYVMDEDALSRDDVIGKVCLPRDTLASHPKDLAPKDRNGASDPFVRVRYKGRTQETSIVKKSCYPRWNETFEFELEEGATEVLCVETWDWDLVSRNDFLGKVVIDIQRLQVAQPEEGWFRLQPDQTKSRRHDEGNLGSLQLEVRLRDEMVLPSSCYQPLVQLLCHEVKLGMQGPGQLISLIEETTSTECRQDVATNLLKLFLGQGLAKDFLDLLFQLELSRTSETNTLFRSNSLASKSMESFLKNVPFIAVTSFLCLRFFSPAIMSPKLFHLRERHADARTSRTLLLLAKAVQNVGNMDTPASRAKEAWMEPLQPTVRQGVAQLKDFITKLVDIEEKDELDLQRTLSLQAPPVKEGPLFIHRTKGKGPLMSSSFKKLYFFLTTEALSFAKTPSSKCVNELNQWLSALRKVSINNTGLLGSYHPGVFRGDKWSCCHQKEKTGQGCDKTRSRVTLQEWNDPLDHDLEAQLIYRHLLGVEAMLWERHRELSRGAEAGTVPPSPGEAPKDSLAQLLWVLQDLREAHSSSLAGSPPSEPNCLLELQT